MFLLCHRAHLRSVLLPGKPRAGHQDGRGMGFHQHGELAVPAVFVGVGGGFGIGTFPALGWPTTMASLAIVFSLSLTPSGAMRGTRPEKEPFL